MSYCPSQAIGLLAGRFAAAEWHGETPNVPPPTTAHGALIAESHALIESTGADGDQLVRESEVVMLGLPKVGS